MKTPNPWVCDVCQRAKGPSNGWLIGIPVFANANSFSGNEPTGRAYVNVVPTETSVEISPAIKAAFGYTLVEWSETLAETCATSPVHHLCSETCAHKRLWENIRRGAQVGPAGPDFRVIDSEAIEVERPAGQRREPEQREPVVGASGFAFWPEPAEASPDCIGAGADAF